MTDAPLSSDIVDGVARALREAEALLITAGAGIGVDSGLPDFRGDQGFWKAYPPYAKLGLSFASIANAQWFAQDPSFAWGFYGHRLSLNRATRPHAGFAILKRWAGAMSAGAWVFTSNVDGQFQRAGFDPERITECHGAIDFLQCTRACGVGIFPAAGHQVTVDPESFHASEPLPCCPRCGALARPNILMFGDGAWDGARTHAQSSRMNRWLDGLRGRRVVVVECGAGTHIPTARHMSEGTPGMLVRINPRESQGPAGTRSLPVGALRGLEAIDAALAGWPGVRALPPVSVHVAAIDAMIASIDARLSEQLREILHHPAFQRLEATWRSLKYLVDQVDFRENITVEVLNVSKEALINDFDGSPEVVKSGMYKRVYADAYAMLDGKPIGLIVGDYDFGPGEQDIALLQKIAAIAAMAHAPFVAAASPSMFGLDSWEQLPALKDLWGHFQGPQYARWQSFREGEDSRYVGLTLPRFLLRLPYGANTVPVSAFAFEEQVEGAHDHYLWGNAAVALASRVADSFAKYRWCPNIIGPQAGGTVEDLPLHRYEAMGEIQTKIPTEVQLTERREYELSEEGFIGLTFREDSNNACFLSANSVQKAKHFGQSPEGREAATNYRLGTQLPYMFMVARFAHYLKLVTRARVGAWMERSDIERGLNEWMRDYALGDIFFSPVPRPQRRYAIREAAISVEDVDGQPRWYRLTLKLRPNFKYMGSRFELSLLGQLDKD